MSIIYYPSCNFSAKFPKASNKIKNYMKERTNIEIAGCCKPTLKNINENDTVVYVCNSCHVFFKEQSASKNIISIWEYILSDEAFKYPDLSGEKITIQDCWRTYDNKAEQDAVRQVLKKMNVEVIEQKENYENTKFCGVAVYNPLQEYYKTYGPKRFIEDAKEHNHFQPHSEDEQKELMEKHCSEIETSSVVCYCLACTIGINIGGKRGTHLAELVFSSK